MEQIDNNIIADERLLLADTITSKGISIKFKHNTPLAYLNNLNCDETSIRSISNKIADKVVTNITYIYNTLLPIYKDSIAYCKDIYSKYQPDLDYNKWSIEELDTNDFLLNVDTTNNAIITKMSDVPVEFLEYKTTYPELVKSHLSLAKSDDNIRFSKVINNLGEEGITKVWNNLLCNFRLNNNQLTTVLNNPILYSNELATLYVIFKNLKDNKPSFIKSEQYGRFVDEAESVINVAINLYKQQVRSYKTVNRLVIGVKNNTITVYKPVYDEFLQSGGIPDIILGLGLNFSNDDVESGVLNDIMSNAESYKSTWNSYVALSKHKVGLREGELWRNTYKILIDNLFKEIIPNNVIDNHSDYCNIKVAEEALNNVLAECGNDTKMISNVEKVVGMILGNVFGDTELGFIIRTMKHYGNKYQIDPNQAASLAIIDYISTYLALQLES